MLPCAFAGRARTAVRPLQGAKKAAPTMAGEAQAPRGSRRPLTAQNLDSESVSIPGPNQHPHEQDRFMIAPV